MTQMVEIDLDGRKITLETGKVAKQANGAVVVRSGDSVVLVTACSTKEPKPGASFLPLTVDYREYTYAAGRFPGGFIKREGRPTEREILVARLIDRPIRPLFPEGYSCETQLIGFVLSADPELDPAPLAIVGAAAALAISDIPFPHILGGVQVGLVNGKLVANPTYSEAREAKLNITVAATDDGIVMVEAGAVQASEAEVISAIEFGHRCCRTVAAGIRELVAMAGKPKREFVPPVINQELYEHIASEWREALTDALNTEKYTKIQSYSLVEELRKKAVEGFPEEQR
ncbi:MAG: polyribonucleotide nucleotidyltransferase, partial [Bryobacteraceae bacterium]|nr:polyribonucleotide nucleotidyltransferase [Bryobacteraceae bacterium]